jgi:DNA modification methylase
VNYEKEHGGNLAENVDQSNPFLIIILGEMVCLHGVNHVPSGTPLKISVSVKKAAGHPTVKPVSLMRWLVRLITPPNGTVLDMFAGTGTTGQAAMLEGFKSVLIEREVEYVEDIERRMKLVFEKTPLKREKTSTDGASLF